MESKADFRNSTASTIRGPGACRNRSTSASIMLPVCMALSPANGGIIVINDDNLGAGSGAGVIVMMTSGLAIKTASGLISANPGYGPEFERSEALFSIPISAATRPVYEDGSAAYKFWSGSDIKIKTLRPSSVPAAVSPVSYTHLTLPTKA